MMKRKGAENVYTCGNCGTVFKFSWLEQGYINGLCPFCWVSIDVNNVTIVELPKAKYDYNMPLIVRLQLSKNRLVAEFKERSQRNWETQSMGDLESVSNDVALLRDQIEKLDVKINKLKGRAKNLGININDIYK